MAEALKTVGWIQHVGNSVSIVTPKGVMGEDGYPDYKAMLTDEKIKALEKIGISPEQFIAGMKEIRSGGSLGFAAGTEVQLDLPVDSPYLSDYGVSVAGYLSK